MNLNNRQKQILNELETSSQVRVTKLAKKLFASEMTIRRDLEYLEKEGFLIRCHGGAIPIGNHLLYPIKYRMWINTKEKKDLALVAKQYFRTDRLFSSIAPRPRPILFPISRNIRIYMLLQTLFIFSRFSATFIFFAH